jgi:hypothetical protein
VTSPTKALLHTYREDVAQYFYNGGARVKVLYVADDIPCFEVQLKGRPLKRLLETPTYRDLAAKTVSTIMAIGQRRVQPPLYVVREGEKFVTLQDTQGRHFVAIARSPDVIWDAMKIPVDHTAELSTADAVKEFLEAAKADGVFECRYIVGFVDKKQLPYNETYNIDFLLAGLAAPPPAEQAPTEPAPPTDEPADSTSTT